MNRHTIRSLPLYAAALLFLLSCTQMERQPLSQLDTPEHHTYTGIRLMNQGKYNDAEREFILAMQLNSGYSQAYAGKGLVEAYRGDFEKAFDLMKKAGECAQKDREKVFHHTGMLRLFTMSKIDKDWCDDAADEFDKAIHLNPKYAPAYYFMGVAFKTALKFDEAAPLFAKVLDIKDEYVREADREWKLIQKIQRAMPGTRRGRQIALVESITRADLAALLMEELTIERIYEKVAVKDFDGSFKAAGTDTRENKTAPARAVDIDDHVLSADIERITHIGIRGLEVYPDGTFRPDDLITRAAYAMILEDILITVKQEPGLATKFIGSVSPFPDLRNDNACFNAVMVVTSRGIMQVNDFTSGEFAPLASVSGADALLIIRNMREELRSF